MPTASDSPSEAMLFAPDAEVQVVGPCPPLPVAVDDRKTRGPRAEQPRECRRWHRRPGVRPPFGWGNVERREARAHGAPRRAQHRARRGVTCWAMLPLTAGMEPPWNADLAAMLRGEARAGRYAAVAFAVAWVGIGLRALVDHLTRRASTPLPPPAPDPLATYREAPAECPRHPFAR